MTPEAWFAVRDPGPLVIAVRDNPATFSLQPEAVDRRLRLFACAVSRQVWDLLPTDVRSAVQASERYAERLATVTDLLASAVQRQDGPITASQLALATAQAATKVPQDLQQISPFLDPSSAARDAARAVAIRDVGPAPPGRPTTPEWHTAWTAAFAAARAIQADYLRDIFMPPQYIPKRDPFWITSTVLALARQMDESGDFSAVPILADAIQDAGCEDEILLECCRTQGNIHVRGNWVVDLILDRV